MDQHRASRNDPCPCGSGKKYKHCCLREEAEAHAPRPSPTITDLQGKSKKRPEYPIGTVALYGPDDKTTTKIAAGVITSLTAEPTLELDTRMILDPDDAERFFRLHKALTLFVNQRLKLTKPPARSEGIVALSPEQRLKARDALVEHLDLIDAFVEEDPYKFGPDELDIIRSWKALVAGEFYVLRFLKKYTVFLTAKGPTVAYGVVGLSDPFEEVIDQPLPFFCKTVLLPFRGRIVYDGLLSGYNLLIGRNMTGELNDAYNAAKKRHGVITSLPWIPETPKVVTRRGTAPKKERPRRGGGLTGRWRIVWMENWGQDFVDEEVEGFFEFDRDGGGEFQFGYVSGGIDHRQVERDGRPAVEFSWDGHDEMDPAQGRGWAVLDGDEIEGRILFHRGDESAFRAVRTGR